MKKLEFKTLVEKIVRKELQERVVYKSGEFESIDNALATIKDNVYAFDDKRVQTNILKFIKAMDTYVTKYGTEQM